MEKQLKNEVERLLFRYIPHSTDPIDRALASFINTHPELQKMKIMFLRESEGVYKFGQSRVYVKVGTGSNSVQVKVGGGFMMINEFIKKFEPIELEKLDRKYGVDTLVNRFQNKL